MTDAPTTRMTVPSGPQMRAAALLFALAEQLTAGIMPAPNEINFVSFDNDAATLLHRAEAQDVNVQVSPTNAWINAHLFTDEADDLRARYTFHSNTRPTDAEREAYSQHNADRAAVPAESAEARPFFVRCSYLPSCVGDRHSASCEVRIQAGR